MREWTPSMRWSVRAARRAAAVGLLWAAAWAVTAGAAGLASPGARAVGVTGLVAAGAFLLATLLWRQATMGVYTGDRGVLVRFPLYSRTVRWEAVSDFASRQGKSLGVPARADVIWVELVSGAAFQTPITTRRDGASLGGVKRGMRRLSRAEYLDALDGLRQRLRTRG